MSEEESTQLCTKSKLSQDETEASNDRQSKKHKNDTSDSFDSDVFETNKKVSSTILTIERLLKNLFYRIS